MTRFQDMVTYVMMGFRAFGKHPARVLLSLAYWLVVLAMPTGFPLLLDLGPPLSKLLSLVCWVLGVPALALLYLFLVGLSAVPRHTRRIEHACQRVGLTNRLGETPFVKSNDNGVIVLKTRGVPLSEFETRKEGLESALNLRIVRVSEGADIEHVILHTAPGNAQLPKEVLLDLEALPPGDSVLALGVSLDGTVTVDLSVTPHILCGGASGGGKSEMFISLAAQALKKRMDVYILDMKAGVDYPMPWKQGLCHFYDGRESILEALTELEGEMNCRKALFANPDDNGDGERPYRNLKDYNRRNPHNRLPYICVFIDELGQITDPTGMDKATKALIDAINAKLGSLARAGRFCGISTCIGTQRPDSIVVNGQVKSNADVRVAFRSDSVLSTIILDNGDAAKLPKDIPGRCLCNLTGDTALQGYLYLDPE